jgi:hypothetical protein
MNSKPVSEAPSTGSRQTKFSKLLAAFKSKLLPHSTQERAKRYEQLKDVAIFVASIGAFILLQNKIRKLITVDTEELKKLSL